MKSDFKKRKKKKVFAHQTVEPMFSFHTKAVGGGWSGSLDPWFKPLWMWLWSFESNKWTTERKWMLTLALKMWICVYIFSEHSQSIERKIKWKQQTKQTQFPFINFTLKWCEEQLISAWFPQISGYNLNPHRVTAKS